MNVVVAVEHPVTPPTGVLPTDPDPSVQSPQLEVTSRRVGGNTGLAATRRLEQVSEDSGNSLTQSNLKTELTKKADRDKREYMVEETSLSILSQTNGRRTESCRA